MRATEIIALNRLKELKEHGEKQRKLEKKRKRLHREKHGNRPEQRT
jgi:hypothetical protein